jgi:hypothetical protein
VNVSDIAFHQIYTDRYIATSCPTSYKQISYFCCSRYAFRNISDAPAVVLVITTKKRGQFFQEIGRPQTGTPLPVTPEDLEHFAVIFIRGSGTLPLKRNTSEFVNLAIY